MQGLLLQVTKKTVSHAFVMLWMHRALQQYRVMILHSTLFRQCKSCAEGNDVHVLQKLYKREILDGFDHRYYYCVRLLEE